MKTMNVFSESQADMMLAAFNPGMCGETSIKNKQQANMQLDTTLAYMAQQENDTKRHHADLAPRSEKRSAQQYRADLSSVQDRLKILESKAFFDLITNTSNPAGYGSAQHRPDIKTYDFIRQIAVYSHVTDTAQPQLLAYRIN